MPTTPRPKLKAAPTGASSAKASAGASEGKAPRSSSPASSSPRRTPKNATLREKVERFYMMIGTILIPFGRFIPQLGPLGENLRNFSEEAADAWIDLAEEDPKVKKYLESFVGASTWGNVIGVHFAIFMAVIPAQGQNIAKAMTSDENDPMAVAKAMGLSDDEIEKAFKMAENIVSDRPPEPSVGKTEGKKEEKKQDKESVLREKMQNDKSGIVSPNELGVQNPGDFYNGPMTTGGMPK